MSRTSRRSFLLRSSAMPLAGMLGLPSLSEAAQSASFALPPAQTEDHRNPHRRGARPRVPGSCAHLYGPGHHRPGRIDRRGPGQRAADPFVRADADRPGPAEHRGRVRAHPHLRHLRRRAGRPVRHGAHRRRDRALGYRRQGAGRAGVPVAGRQGARPRPRLLRFGQRGR